MDGIMHLVLNRRKESFGRCGGRIIIKCSCVDICDLLVKLALRKPDFTDLLKLALKIFIGQWVFRGRVFRGVPGTVYLTHPRVFRGRYT